MRRRWKHLPWWVVLGVLVTGSLLGGAATDANAAAASPAQAGEYYYGPVNCHSHPTIPAPGGSRQQYADYLVTTIAPRYHLEAAVLLWQVQQESGFNPNVVSRAGAVGIAQLTHRIWEHYGVNPYDPWASLDVMARYDLASLRAFWGWSHAIAVRFGGNRNAYAWGLALAAYNAGGPNTGAALGWADRVGWDRGPWTWLWWFGDANQTFYYVPDILGCEATS